MIRQIVENTRYNFINEEDAQNLLTYQYKSKDDSLLYKHILSPIADHSLQYVPLWMAPNVISFLGLTMMLIPQSIIWYYISQIPTEQELPYWLSVMTFLCQMVYINLDNIDGKQARRTKNSSPLGMLVDHQIDCLITVLQTINVMIIWKTNVFQSLTVLTVSTCVFFYATIEEYYTDVLHLPFINGANEGNLLSALLFLIPSSIYQQTVSIYGYTCTVAFLSFLVFVVMTPQILFHTVNQIYKKGGIKSVCNMVQKSLSFWYMIISLFLLNKYSINQVCDSQLRLICYIYMFNLAKLVGCAQIAHLTGSEFMSIRKSIIYTFTIINVNTFYQIRYKQLLFDENYLILALVIYSMNCYFQFAFNVAYQISEILQIKIFKINSVQNVKKDI